MPRKGHIVKRDVLPDPIYQSKLVTRIVNTIMVDGKKKVQLKVYYTEHSTALKKLQDASRLKYLMKH